MTKRAQRRRASRGRARDHRRRLHADHRVLNAEGHHGRTSPQVLGWVGGAPPPKGITGRAPSASGASRREARMCSTPKGIIGSGNAPSDPSDAGGGVERPTPKGITGSGTRRPGSRPPSRGVLDQCSTPKGITGAGTRCRRWRFPSWECFNAEGHHGGRALVGKVDFPHPRLCARRVRRARGGGQYPSLRDDDRTRTSCSTPKGITGSGTSRNRPGLRARLPLCVLNAEGHHGGGHSADLITVTSRAPGAQRRRYRCRGTLIRVRWASPSACAQRRRASRGSGHSSSRWTSDTCETRMVCSTPKGITGAGTPKRGAHPSTTWRCGAQRRRASRGRAHRAWPAPSTLLAGCSTPKGITGAGTMTFSETTGRGFMCSTPKGITGAGTMPTIWTQLLDTWPRAQRRRASRGAGTGAR